MNEKIELKNFCKNVEKLMQDYSLSNRQMMKIMHVSYKSLISIKNGVIPKRVSTTVLFYLNRHLNVDMASLFTEKYKISKK